MNAVRNLNVKKVTSKPKISYGEKSYLNLRISFIDDGVGISPQGIKKLFVDFGKLSENSQRNKSGTGLGLSICKKIIEQMGGNVRVEST